MGPLNDKIEMNWVGLEMTSLYLRSLENYFEKFEKL